MERQYLEVQYCKGTISTTRAHSTHYDARMNWDPLLLLLHAITHSKGSWPQIVDRTAGVQSVRFYLI
jgi:hypothetical protein